MSGSTTLFKDVTWADHRGRLKLSSSGILFLPSLTSDDAQQAKGAMWFWDILSSRKRSPPSAVDQKIKLIFAAASDGGRAPAVLHFKSRHQVLQFCEAFDQMQAHFANHQATINKQQTKLESSLADVSTSATEMMSSSTDMASSSFADVPPRASVSERGDGKEGVDLIDSTKITTKRIAKYSDVKLNGIVGTLVLNKKCFLFKPNKDLESAEKLKMPWTLVERAKFSNTGRPRVYFLFSDGTDDIKIYLSNDEDKESLRMNFKKLKEILRAELAPDTAASKSTKASRDADEPGPVVSNGGLKESRNSKYSVAKKTVHAASPVAAGVATLKHNEAPNITSQKAKAPVSSSSAATEQGFKKETRVDPSGISTPSNVVREHNHAVLIPRRSVTAKQMALLPSLSARKVGDSGNDLTSASTEALAASMDCISPVFTFEKRFSDAGTPGAKPRAGRRLFGIKGF